MKRKFLIYKVFFCSIISQFSKAYKRIYFKKKRALYFFDSKLEKKRKLYIFWLETFRKKKNLMNIIFNLQKIFFFCRNIFFQKKILNCSKNNFFKNFKIFLENTNAEKNKILDYTCKKDKFQLFCFIWIKRKMIFFNHREKN